MNHTKITVKQARALVLVAPKDTDVRWYLNGALFDFETRRAVATDGHCLLAINVVTDAPSDIQAIIPRDALHDISRGGKVDGAIEISADAETFKLSRLNDERSDITGKLIAGTYPDYTRVMPDKVSGELVQFNWQLLARIDKALKLALDIDKQPSKLTTVGHNGESGATLFVRGHSDTAIAVCMPLRAPQKGGWGSSDAEMLDFFSKGEPEKAEKAA